MQNFETRTVAEIALAEPVATRVFEDFGIDYCCGGKAPFIDACRRANADPQKVIELVESEIGRGNSLPSEDFETLTALIDHIEATHHVFTRSEIEHLTPLMAKVLRVHGDAHPELGELARLVGALFAELMPHLTKEENVLFPYIRSIARGMPSGSCFGSVANPVRAMMNEHDNAGEMLRKMREVTLGYTLPVGACGSYMALYARLEALEKDLHRHIHLENNLLFPRAIVLDTDIS
jgi:regulator of cell morphogenesis and NO signaling